MNILFYDTETTGLPKDYKAPSSDSANWPHLVQVAFMLATDEGEELEYKTLIIKPNGYEIPEEVSKLHGITTEMANAVGVDLLQALEMFWECQQKAQWLVAHNASFDGKIIRAACHRVGFTDELTKGPTLDTMLLSTKYCNLPGPRGPKWPKLSELHKKIFGVEHDNAHDAMGDVRATKKCFFELRKMGIITFQSFEDALTKHKEIERKVKEKAEREAAK